MRVAAAQVASVWLDPAATMTKVVGLIDPARIASARYSFDPTGHYARPDVFAVTVDRRRQEAVAFTA